MHFQIAWRISEVETAIAEGLDSVWEMRERLPYQLYQTLAQFASLETLTVHTPNHRRSIRSTFVSVQFSAVVGGKFTFFETRMSTSTLIHIITQHCFECRAYRGPCSHLVIKSLSILLEMTNTPMLVLDNL